MHTCFAIDDEFSALELITDYINSHTDFKLLKTFNNPLLALKEISKLSKPVDVIFLDVEMPEMDGIELANLIRHKTKKLIFTTAHTRYAVNSYELEADAFLLKPYPLSKFSQVLERVFPEYEEEVKKYKHNASILLKSIEQRNKLIKVQLSNIIAVEAKDKHVKIYLDNEIIFAYSTLSEILCSLNDAENFTQIHRSFIISENHIKGIERTHVLLSNNLKIPIGRMYRDFYQRISRKN